MEALERSPDLDPSVVGPETTDQGSVGWEGMARAEHHHPGGRVYHRRRRKRVTDWERRGLRTWRPEWRRMTKEQVGR